MTECKCCGHADGLDFIQCPVCGYVEGDFTIEDFIEMGVLDDE